MDVWKYEIISFALLTCEISWSTLEINFIFPHIHVFFPLFINITIIITITKKSIRNFRIFLMTNHQIRCIPV